MSRTKAEKKTLKASQVFKPIRAVIPPTPDVTPEQGKEAVKLLLSVIDYDMGYFFFSSSREWKGGTCAQENGRGYDCSACRAVYFLKKIGALN